MVDTVGSMNEMVERGFNVFWEIQLIQCNSGYSGFSMTVQ